MEQESPKKRAWRRMQSEEPDIAELMTTIENRFGRPRLIEFEIKGERVWPPKQKTE